MSDAEHLPWDMRDEESPQAFEAFATYRDMGAKRGIRAVAHKLDKSVTLLGRWSSQHDWPNRARAFDQWMDQQARSAWTDEYRTMVEETNSAGRLLVTKAMQRLNGAGEKAIPHDAIRALEVAAKIQNQGMIGIKPDTQSEKDSALQVDAAALIEEMYKRAAAERDGATDG